MSIRKLKGAEAKNLRCVVPSLEGFEDALVKQSPIDTDFSAVDSARAHGHHWNDDHMLAYQLGNSD